MKHVFISYVHENDSEVNWLANGLRAQGVKVWLDQNDIPPGVRWPQAVRRGIQDGAYFLACFSKEYNERSITYMNEELTIAIEILRQRPTDQSWFIPVKLNKCEIPDRDIGGGDTLRRIQWVELYQDRSAGLLRLVKLINPTPPELQALAEALKSNDKDVRFLAVRSLGKHGKQGIPYLVDALEDIDEHVQARAIITLQEIGNHANEAMLKAVLEHKSENVRFGAAAVLSKTTPAGIGPALVKALRDPSFRVASIVSEVIGKIADDETVELLIKMLIEEEENNQVLVTASKALVPVGERVVPMLIKNLDPKKKIAGLINALIQIGEPSVQPLIDILHDDKRKLLAVYPLGKIGDDRAVNPLKQMLVEVELLNTQLVIQALENIGTADAISAIEDFYGTFAETT